MRLTGYIASKYCTVNPLHHCILGITTHLYLISCEAMEKTINHVITIDDGGREQR